MSFIEYLNENCIYPDLKEWNKWQMKYIQPSYDKQRYNEMIINFGYASESFHNFENQYKAYQMLKENIKMDEGVKMFIGFMAGNGFFEHFKISVEEWLNSKNWFNPNLVVDEGYSIYEILSLNHGLNFIKMYLPQMPYWRR